MASLSSVMPRNKAGVIDPTHIERAIFESCLEVEKCLKPYLKLKLNSSSENIFLPHSQNQVMSFVIEHLLNNNDLETWKSRPSKIPSQILQNLAAHYLYDIIRNSWRGSGDSRLSSLSWEEDGRVASYYATPISEKLLSEALRTWHEEILGKKQRERASISSSVKATLIFVYANLVTVFEDQKIEFEIEHIYPVGYLSERIKKSKDEGWPISAVGNLMILPKQINRIKGKNLLGDFLPELERLGGIDDDEKKQIQRYLLSPDWQEISSEKSISKNSYLDFCKKRLEVMEKIILKDLKLS